MTLRPPLVLSNDGRVQRVQDSDGIQAAQAKIGDTTLIHIDGSKGQMRTTNGAGVESWTFPPGPMRNFLVNPQMRFDQFNGGNAYTLTTFSGVTNYTLDQWQAWIASAVTATATRFFSTALNQLPFAQRIQRTSGQTNTPVITLSQLLESNQSFFLQGQTCTLSFYARSGANFSAASSALKFRVAYGTGSNESSAAFQAGSATGYTDLAEQTATLTTSWTRFLYTFALDASATQVAIRFYFTPVGTAGAADNFDITGVQLEVADHATPFEHCSFNEDLSLCQRHFCKSFGVGTPVAQNSGSQNGAYHIMGPASGNVGGTWFYPQTMRTTPTITTYNPNNTNANWRDITNGADRTVTVSVIGQNSVMIYLASGVAAAQNIIHLTASTRL